MAVRLCSGKYIVNIDADDLMHPEKIEQQVLFFMENKDFFLIGTEALIIHSDEIPLWGKLNNNLKINEIDQRILLGNRISHSTVMMKRVTLEKIGGYNEKLQTQVDYDLWLRAFQTGCKMGNINFPLSAKRIHENQSYENKKRLRYTWNSMKLQYKYIVRSPKHFYYLPVPFIRFVFAQLPFSSRQKINSLIKSLK